MEHIERFIAIADKLYLREEISDDDYLFFSKYLSKMIPKWYTWDFKDVVSEVILYMLDMYDINADVWKKKKYMEQMVFKQASVLEEKDFKLKEWVYSYDIDMDMIESEEDITEAQNTKFIHDKIVEGIYALANTVDDLRKDILIDNILNWEPLINVSKKHPECSYQWVSQKRLELLELIKKRYWYLLEN